MLESPTKIHPSRSPFMTGRLRVMHEGRSLQDMLNYLPNMPPSASTFKVMVDKMSKDRAGLKIKFEQRREIEREIGLCMRGQAELDTPERVYGILISGERWMFGEHLKGEAIWLHHMKKPQAYSTALSTRVARAVVNIAVPNPDGVRAIDPCCGIGNVLIEALSMGINIVGRDINPLVTRGARENIAHFGLSCDVSLGAIENVKETYDVAIIDMPYNLCSTLPPAEQLSMLQSAARIAPKIVIITIEPIDPILKEAGLTIIDHCIVKKRMFRRQIIVCESKF